MKPLYDHTIELIELTKLLERDVCDTMTVTNYLGHNYPVGGQIAQPTTSMTNKDWLYQSTNYYHTPTQVGLEYTIFNPMVMFYYDDGSTRWRPVYSDGKVTVLDPDGETIFSGVPSEETGQQVLLSKKGTYKISADLHFFAISSGQRVDHYGDAIWLISTIEMIAQSTPWTITDVVNRILSAGVTRRIGIDAQKYVFDSEQAAKYTNVLAPEFFFTRGTLWEALSTVGGFIHGIPRLINENREDGRLTVHFDELNFDGIYEGKLPSVRYYDEQISGEEYCEEIDSPAQNLLNTKDKATGAVTEPSMDGWRAVNCPEGDVTIEADTMTFLTDQPIYQVTGLEVKWGANGETKDIFPYLYEQAEYRVLSSYSGDVYPYSKGWALCYTQGGKEITGLNFTLTQPDGASVLRNKYAIVNIFEALGFDIDNDADFANNLFYRITYIPQAELRVTQKKSYLSHNGAGTLIYNQGGNTIESEYFGQKMKGAISRIGNIIRRRTFIYNKYSQMPKVGQIYSPDGAPEKITNVDRTYEKLYIKATVTSVPNFNRIAEYTGVDSNYRLYDISEKQSVDRFVHYEESCVLSNRSYEAGTPMLTGEYGLKAYMSMFTTAAETDNPYKITAAIFNSRAGRTENDSATGVENNTIALACASFGFGCSLVFYANTQDNYGAGRQSSDDYWTSSSKRRTSKQVQYGDALGNISEMDVTLGTKFMQSADIPFDYPQGNNDLISLEQRLLNSSDKPFFISKDSREAIHFSYQLHHQADNYDIVIGNGLSRFNTLVSAKRKALSFIWMTQRPLDLINPQISAYFQDPNFPTVTEDPSTSKQSFSIGTMVNPTEKTVYGWAIVARGALGEIEDIIVGQNYPDGLAAGAGTKPLYFNFMDNAHLAECEME